MQVDIIAAPPAVTVSKAMLVTPHEPARSWYVFLCVEESHHLKFNHYHSLPCLLLSVSFHTKERSVAKWGRVHATESQGSHEREATGNQVQGILTTEDM